MCGKWEIHHDEDCLSADTIVIATESRENWIHVRAEDIMFRCGLLISERTEQSTLCFFEDGDIGSIIWKPIGWLAIVPWMIGVGPANDDFHAFCKKIASHSQCHHCIDVGLKQ